VKKVRERLAVNKQGLQRFLTESFNLKKIKKIEDKEKYRVEVSNRFAALEDFDVGVDINEALNTIRENIKISDKEYRLF
jgi:hypothetical protein